MRVVEDVGPEKTHDVPEARSRLWDAPLQLDRALKVQQQFRPGCDG